MEDQYIYVVGKVDKHANLPEIVHRLGYKLGILLDDKHKLSSPELFDRVVPINFDDIDSELLRLDSLNLSAVGLQCTYENYIVAKAKLGQHFGLYSPSVKSALLSTDKSLMREAFIKADPTISPRFAPINSLHQAINFAKAHSYPLIIKPTNLVKSLLVLRCNNEQELTDNFAYATKVISALYKKYHIYGRSPQLIIEEFIFGKQCSVAAFVDQHGTPHFCEGIVDLTNAQDINIDDNYLYKRMLPAQLDPILTSEIYRVATLGIKALDMTSIPAHVELMHNNGVVKIIEIGARIGGYRPRMYQYSYGTDLNFQELLLALGEQPDVKGELKAHSAVYELLPTAVGKFDGVSENLEPSLAASYLVTVKPGDVIGPAKNGYKATVIIIVTDEDNDIFINKCLQVERIKVKITL